VTKLKASGAESLAKIRLKRHKMRKRQREKLS